MRVGSGGGVSRTVTHASAEPPPDCRIELEEHLDGPGGDTLGWLARDEAGHAFWCGELSRADFKRQSAEVRCALRNDLGWFLAEIKIESAGLRYRVLAKVASEGAAPEILRAMLISRLHQAGLRAGEVTTRRVEEAYRRPAADVQRR